MRKNKLNRFIAICTAALMVVTGPGTDAYAGVNVVKNEGVNINESTLDELKEVDGSKYLLQAGGFLQKEVTFDNGLNKATDSVKAAAKEAIKAAILNMDEEVDLSSFNLNSSEAGQLFWAAVNDAPGAFYVGNTYRPYGTASCITKIGIVYSDSMDKIKAMKKEYDAVVTAFVAGANKNWSDMEKALYINDYLCTNCEYDLTYSKYDAYNVLVEKTAVCQGYALAFKELANQLGLECTLVTSSTLNHAWDMVKINGKYYMVDSTWNDPINDKIGRSRHYYFMKSYAYFNSSSGKHEATDYVVGSGDLPSLANDTSYDTYFWNSVDTMFVNIDTAWYTYASGAVKMYQYSNGNMSEMASIKNISGRWPASSNAYYSGMESVAYFDGAMYLSQPDSIIKIIPSQNSFEEIYKLNDTQKAKGYIYGLTILSNGEVKAQLQQLPSSDRNVETILKLEKSDTGSGNQEDDTKGDDETGSGNNKEEDKNTPLADAITGFKLNTIDGKTVTSEANGKPKVLFFSLAKCGNCTYTGMQLEGLDLSAMDFYIIDLSNLSLSDAQTNYPSKYDMVDGAVFCYGKEGNTLSSRYISLLNASQDGYIYTPFIVLINEKNKVVHYSMSYNSNFKQDIEKYFGITLNKKENSQESISIKTAKLTLAQTEYVYNGEKKEPSVQVDLDGKTLEQGTDYTVEYSSNINAGTGVVKITGINKYTGEASTSFKINKAKEELTLVPSSTVVECNKTVTIKSVGGHGTVTLNNKTPDIISLSNYEVTGLKGGKAIIEANSSGDANYEAASTMLYLSVESCEIKIEKTIKTCDISLDSTKFVYSGSAHKPTVTVIDEGTILKEGTDYVVSYTGNIYVGSGKVTVTGVNDYTGTVTKIIVIEKADNILRVIAPTQEIQCGANTTLDIVGVGEIKCTSSDTSIAQVTDDGVISAKNSGTVAITVTAQGNDNYNAASKTVYITVGSCSIEVKKKSIENCSFTILSSGAYTGSAKKAVMFIEDNGAMLEEGKDYETQCTNNINAGNATVKITGIGSYEGSITKTFIIEKAKQNITADVESKQIKVGQTTKITTNGKGNITYSTCNKDIVTISKDGVVTGLSEGIAVIDVVADGGENYELAEYSFAMTVEAIPQEYKEKDISSCDIYLEGLSFEYDETAKKPGVTVIDKYTTLSLNVDYKVEYIDNINAGTGKINITGIGDYTGTVTKRFAIVKAKQHVGINVDRTDICIGDSVMLNAVANGQISFTSSNKDIATVSDTGEVKAIAEGVVKITINATETSNYTAGVRTIQFVVSNCKLEAENISIDECEISLIERTMEYTGDKCCATVIVKYNGTKLTQGTDYTLSYKDNINAGTAKVTITGVGKYMGASTKSFYITKKKQSISVTVDEDFLTVGDIVKIKVTGAVTNLTYTSSDDKIATVASDGTVKAISKGYAYITVSAVGNNNVEEDYSYVSLYISGAASDYEDDYEDDDYSWNIAESIITLDKDEYTYTGTAIKAGVVVIDADLGKLIENEDYTLTFSNNTNVGTATVVIKGIGIFSGSVTKNFKIIAASDIGDDDDIDDNDDYEDELWNIAECKITLAGTAYTYTGKAITPKVSVYDNEIGNLYKGEDYTVTYISNVNVGIAKVIIKGIGYYEGSVTKSFKINPKATTGITVRAASYNSIKVSWTRDTKVNGYQIYRSTNKNSGYKLVGTVKSNTITSFVDKNGIKTGTNYYYKVRAFKSTTVGNLYGGYSKVVYTKTTLVTPKITYGSNNGTKKATIKWGKVAGASGYVVYRSTSKNSGYKQVAKTKSNVLSFANTRLVKNKTYYYKVRAYITVAGKPVYSAYSTYKAIKITR